VKSLEEIVLEVWGDFACFSEPQAKVERLSYPFPPPSAARGILSAIYAKNTEFYWQVNRIEVLNPIQYISFKRNEVKCTATGKDFVYTEDERTQRQTVALKDVRYRIAASIIPRPAFCGQETQLREQALRRIRGGKTFMQPSLGLREFVAYFEEYQPAAGEKKPIADTLDAGLMVYDVFDFVHDTAVQKKTKPALSLFHGVMEQGVVRVPPYESPEVLKGAGIC
jgi:CRISPR-associated protein Cas5d